MNSLGDRMKSYYESRSRTHLMRRSYTLMRIDGKAFHTYTRGLDSPFDAGLIADMDSTAVSLCEKIQGARFAYVQSDEISLLLTDFDTFDTDAWFDYDVQKMTSVSASIATAEFNRRRIIRMASNRRQSLTPNRRQSLTFNAVIPQDEIKVMRFAEFDSRVWQVPCAVEAINYFVWRQQDATRNSIQSAAHALYSQNEMHGKNTDELQEMLFQKGVNWNDYSPREKRGAVVRKTLDGWRADPDTPVFTKDWAYLDALTPSMEEAYA